MKKGGRLLIAGVAGKNMIFTKTRKKYISFALFFISSVVLHAQFILPEDKYTTQRDIDVIRVNDDNLDTRNLKAVIKKVSKGEVLLSWTYSKNNVPVAVIRHDKPLSNMSMLKLGKVINVLDAGQINLKDTVITAGDYYYAVVSYQKLKEENVILKADENFTTAPIHFDEKDLTAQSKLLKEFVSNIKAVILDNKTVRLQWVYEPVPNVSLLIYRSTAEISDENKLKNAMRIGTVPSEKNYFDDQDGSSGDAFYAVTVFTQFEIEKYIFKANQNYTTTAIKKPEIASSVIKTLRASKTKNNQAIITWNDPAPKFTAEYIIYRGNQQILQEVDLQNAAIIQRAAQYSVNYVDKEFPEGDVYYAILTQNKQGTIQKTLVPGDNTMINPVSPGVPEEKEPEVKPEQSLIYDMQATPERNMIHISWKPEKAFFEKLPAKGVFYHIFRFSQKPESIGSLSTDNYIAKINISEESYFDAPIKDGIYYYAIFITTPKGVLPEDLKNGDNLVGPVIYKRGPESDKREIYRKEIKESGDRDVDFSIFENTSQLNEEKINNILKRTYLQENYKEALEALQDYRRSSNRKIRARATFYSALSYYYLGNYRQAMDLMMDDSVKTIYSERADFWYRQILEKMTK
jgi:hypothetical protein